jgi:hypothetical protein
MLVRDLTEQMQGFADSADDALNDPGQTLRGRDREQGASLGVGLYVFETQQEETLPAYAPKSRPKKVRKARGPRNSVRKRRPGGR